MTFHTVICHVMHPTLMENLEISGNFKIVLSRLGKVMEFNPILKESIVDTNFHNCSTVKHFIS